MNIRRNIVKRKRREKMEFPLVKQYEDVVLDMERTDRFGNITGETEEVTRKVLVRDDGGIILNILSQIDWNKSEYKKIRRDMGKVMKAIRKWNFEHSRSKDASGFVTLTRGQIDKLYDILIKDLPDNIKIGGPETPISTVNALITLDEFEEWYDDLKRKEKEEQGQKEKDQAEG